jgi:hypothetical protein
MSYSRTSVWAAAVCPSPRFSTTRGLTGFDDDFNKTLQEIAWKVVQDYTKYDGVKSEKAEAKQ